MATGRTMEIFKALRKYNPKAAYEYLYGADIREKINRAVKDIRDGIVKYEPVPET